MKLRTIILATAAWTCATSQADAQVRAPDQQESASTDEVVGYRGSLRSAINVKPDGSAALYEHGRTFSAAILFRM